VLLLIGWGSSLAARQIPPPISDGSDISVSLVTFGPGARSWERFGHNAIWIRDPSRGIDALYNYGMFNFTEKGFLTRFIRGRMQYLVLPQSPRTLNQYVAEHRSIWVQELNLTPAQRMALRDFLQWNVRPENRRYRYHYYRDNCSTRIRDALDLVLDGQIAEQTTGRAARTYRFHTQRLTATNLPLYLGLLVGLANPVDRPASAWDEMFLPLALRERLADITVTDPAGGTVPLVAAERTLYEDHRWDGAAAPPAWTGWFLLVGVLVAAGVWALGRRLPSSVVARWGFGVFGAAWAALMGAGGGVLAFLWLFTDHDTSYWNENLFFLTPLALPLLVGLPLMAVRAGRVGRWTRRCLLAVAASGVVGFVIQVLPGFDQVNGQVIALVLPVHLALAWLVRRPVSPEATS